MNPESIIILSAAYASTMALAFAMYIPFRLMIKWIKETF